MQAIRQDLRYAIRQLCKSPAFTLTSVLMLGLGLGAAATMYNVVHDVLLAPLPYPAPQELVGVAFNYPGSKPNDEQIGSAADFLQQHVKSFASFGIADDGNTGVNLSFAAGPSSSNAVAPAQVYAHRTSAGYLRTFGSQPLFGHTFTADEDLPHGPHVAVLSYALWQRTFHGDNSIVGRDIQVDEEPYTVIGVMPKTFTDPSTAESTDLWLPLQLSPKDPGYDGDNYQMIGRLRPGVTLAAAQAEAATLNDAVYRQFPYLTQWSTKGGKRQEYRLYPLAQAVTSNVRSSLLAMSAAVAAVLLIACLNLAGLMITRVSDRSRELAIRRALGATQARLLRNLLVEGILLAVCSAVVGLIFARAATPVVLSASPLTLPLLSTSHLWETAAFVFAVSLVACALFSLLPAWHALGRPAVSNLPGRSNTGSDRSQARLGKVLVVAQVALAMVLLAGASLLLGTFLKLQSTSPGFVPKNLVVAQMTMKGRAYETTRQKTQFIDKVITRLQRAPGVDRVAAIDGIPLDRGLNLGMRPFGRNDLAKGAVELRPATPEYFRTLNLPVLAGRTFGDSDDAHAPAVAVISETAARQWFPGVSPLGQRVSTEGSDPIVMQVIGVVGDTHVNSLAEPSGVMVYIPYKQMRDELTKIINTWISTSFVLRTSGDAPLAKIIEQAVSDADPAMPIANIATMQSVIDKTVAAPQFLSWLATSFAGFALLLTVLGLFGLLSYQVAQRTKELGLRLALGATRANLLNAVIQRGLVLTGIGLAVGIVASLAVPRLVGGVLGEILFTGDAPIESVLAASSTTVVLSAIAIFAAAAIASYLPARRAAKVEPMEALRTE